MTGVQTCALPIYTWMKCRTDKNAAPQANDNASPSTGVPADAAPYGDVKIAKPWRRKLWGVVHVTPGCGPLLIGSLWLPPAQRGVPYADEPTRPLLFVRRAAARAYVRAENAKYRARSDMLRRWRMRVVRVVETVREVGL